MPDGTVAGTFSLNAGQALRELRQLRTEGGRTDTTMVRLGKSIDRVGGSAVGIRRVRDEFKGLGRDAVNAERQIRVAMREKTREVARQEAAVRSLRNEMRRLGVTDARARVQVSGVAESIAEVQALRRELRALGRERDTAVVNVRRAGGGGGAGGRPGDQGAGAANAAANAFGRAGSSARLFGMQLSTIAMAATVALPAVQALAGAVVALGSSLASAGAGAGAVGIAGLGALGVGVGTIAGAGIPAIARLQAATKAQTQLRTATTAATQAYGPQYQAVQQLRSAHEGLIHTQEAAQTAQQNLTQTRIEAKRAIEDLSLAVLRSRLGEKRSQLDVIRARQEWIRVQSDPTATPTDLATARLGLQEARLGRREAGVQRVRSVQDRQRGPSQQQAMVTQASRAVRDAAWAARDAREQVAQARYQATGGGGPVNTARLAYQQALANAPRGSARLVSSLSGFRDLWGGRGPGRADPGVAQAQSNFVRMLDRGIGTLTRLTPLLGRIATRTTGALGAASGQFGGFLGGGGNRRFLRTGGDMFAENLPAVERTTEHLVSSFEHLTIAGRPFLRQFTSFIDRWTGGWARSTADIDRTRDRMRPMIQSAKRWGDLAGTTFRLLRDIARLGRPSGDSLVGSLTRTFDRWDRWINTHPERVREWFGQMADSTRLIGSTLLTIIGSLDRMGTALQPLLKGFLQLLHLVGPISQMLAPITGVAGSAVANSPALAAAGYLAYRMGRGGRGGGGGRGRIGGLLAGGAAGSAFGAMTSRIGGAFSGAALGSRLAGGGRFAQFGAGVGGARTAVGRLGGVRSIAGVGARAALPLAAIAGLLGAMNAQGGVGNKVVGGLDAVDPSSLFGLHIARRALSGFIGSPTGADRDRESQQYLSRVSGLMSGRNSIRAQMGNIRQLRLSRGLAGGDDRNLDVTAVRTALKEEIDARREVVHQLREERRLRSRTEGAIAGRELIEGFARRSRRLGPLAAAQQTVSLTMDDVRRRQKTGAGLAGAAAEALPVAKMIRNQAHGNRQMLNLADQLENGIERRWRGLGRGISIIHGRILTGSQQQWSQIANQIASQARRGVDAASAEFSRLDDQALGALKRMGFGAGEARQLLHYERAGGTTARRAQNYVQTYGANGPAPAYRPSSGDTPGLGGPTVADHNARRGRGGGGGGFSGNLMGANPGLSRYASVGSRFGLSVSSGRRPGAITSSGNVSLHASGDAIDLSNGVSTPEELRFARYMANHFGSGLDELIHTPLGFGIKNGKRVPLSFWGPTVNADHFDHVHVGDRTPSGGARGIRGGGRGRAGTGGRGARIRLHARPSGLGGYQGALADQAGGLYAAGLQRMVNQRLGGAGGRGILRGYHGGIMTATQVARLAESVGLPGITFAQIARGESGYNPRAIGHDPGGTLGLGLWQITTRYNDDVIARFGGRQAMLRPRPNAHAAKAIYDRAGIGAWYGTRYMTDPNAHFGGGRGAGVGDGLGVPRWGGWHEKGGRFRVHQPTLFGAGERGTEEVTVRPLGRGRGVSGGINVSVQVHMGRVTVRSNADIDKLAERVGVKVGEKILAAMDGAGDLA